MEGLSTWVSLKSLLNSIPKTVGKCTVSFNVFEILLVESRSTLSSTGDVERKSQVFSKKSKEVKFLLKLLESDCGTAVGSLECISSIFNFVSIFSIE